MIYKRFSKLGLILLERRNWAVVTHQVGHGHVEHIEAPSAGIILEVCKEERGRGEEGGGRREEGGVDEEGECGR